MKPSFLRTLRLTAVGLALFFQVVALMPHPLERAQGVSQVDREELLPSSSEPTLAPGIPTGQVPEYTVDDFEYVYSQGGERQWRLVAEKAYMFSNLRVMHARKITAYLYNPDSEPTVVTGKEAKYFLDERDLEVFGEVVTRFPDGFSTRSEYIRYRPGSRRVQIPDTYRVHGERDKDSDSDQTLVFDSLGMDYPMNENHVYLPRDVTAIMRQGRRKDAYNRGVQSSTKIRSDQCVIDRTANIAHFSMYQSRPTEKRFVIIYQPDLYARSRRADLRYGDFKDVVHYLSAIEDVFIQEIDEESSNLQYATCGRADFDSKKELVILTQFPQVYQDDDTLAGDVILMHRDTGIVEVDYGNAYTTGQNSSSTTRPSPRPGKSAAPSR